MPCINTRVNMNLSPEQEEKIKTRYGKAIACLPGKSEHWLMLNFEEQSHLYFQGMNNAGIAFVEVKLFGKAPADAYKALTQEITDILSSELKIAASHIYVMYQETPHWGWNGSNF